MSGPDGDVPESVADGMLLWSLVCPYRTRCCQPSEPQLAQNAQRAWPGVTSNGRPQTKQVTCFQASASSSDLIGYRKCQSIIGWIRGGSRNHGVDKSPNNIYNVLMVNVHFSVIRYYVLLFLLY